MSTKASNRLKDLAQKTVGKPKSEKNISEKQQGTINLSDLPAGTWIKGETKQQKRLRLDVSNRDIRDKIHPEHGSIDDSFIKLSVTLNEAAYTKIRNEVDRRKRRKEPDANISAVIREALEVYKLD